jgi:hypothetical protein
MKNWSYLLVFVLLLSCKSKAVLVDSNTTMDDSANEKIMLAWKTLENYDIPNKDKLQILTSHPGHFISQGCDYGSLKNPHWLVKDENNREFYIIYCETNGYSYFSK